MKKMVKKMGNVPEKLSKWNDIFKNNVLNKAKELAEYNDSVKFKGYAYKPRIKKYDYIANGKFRFKIIDGKYIKDTKEFSIEQSIPEIIVLIYQEYYKVKNLRLEREERKRLYEEEQERKRKLQNRIEEEKKRTMSLLNMLEDFQTANDLRTVSAPLRDRMDILQLSSYTEFEKLHIAQNFLLKQAQKENGLADVEIKIPDKVMFKLIDEYTREAGVRNLKREIINICRKIAREVVEKDIKKFNLKASDLEKYLGKAKFRPEKSRKAVGKIGVVNGLAWTAVGGVTLDVQGVDTPGKGEVTLTGTLGNVMKESASVAMTYVKANLKKYPPKDKNFFKDRTIHLHFPEGATPKDGPSAGITITTAIVSVLTNKKVRQDIAMTGEITITGDVLAIGGVREKVIGAHRAGIKEVILPEDNRVDTDEIPDELKSTMKIHFAKTYDDVSKLVFVK